MTQQRATGARVEAVGLGRRYESPSGAIDAVLDLSLVIEPGEFCCIVGPSGCGKSTFLRMVAGLESPTSGSLEVRRIDSRAPTNAVVFQGRSLFPWLTLRDNVIYGLRLQGVANKQRQTRAEELLATVGLSRFSTSYPHQVSEGMRQRVTIARALAVEPDILLMDEPFGALDEQTRYLLQEELLRIWSETGRTVVFITHSIDESILLADKIVVMTAQPGTVRDIISVPFPRPRSHSEVRAHHEFGQIFSRVWEQLREEVQFGTQVAAP
ncbi:MAG: ABC transporter ATP-binding protein [Thermomicrobiales bacterium]